MTIKGTFTPMADHLRSEYGTSDLLTVDQIKAGIDGLHAQNYLTAGQTLSYPADSPTKALVGIDADFWNESFLGKTITISFDAKWSGYKNGRIGIEYAYTDKSNVPRYYGSWLYPNTEQGSQHVATTFVIGTEEANDLEEYHMYAQTNADAKVEITNPKVVINPMGG